MPLHSAICSRMMQHATWEESCPSNQSAYRLAPLNTEELNPAATHWKLAAATAHDMSSKRFDRGSLWWQVTHACLCSLLIAWL